MLWRMKSHVQCVLEHFLEDDVEECHLDTSRQHLLLLQCNLHIRAEVIHWQLKPLRPHHATARTQIHIQLAALSILPDIRVCSVMLHIIKYVAVRNFQTELFLKVKTIF